MATEKCYIEKIFLEHFSSLLNSSPRARSAQGLLVCHTVHCSVMVSHHMQINAVVIATSLLLSPNASIGTEGMVKESGNIIDIALKSTHKRDGFVANSRTIYGQVAGMGR